MIIYGLYDPRLPIEILNTRYVGFTSEAISCRLSHHISEAKHAKYNSHRLNWLRSLLKDGFNPIIIILQVIEDSDYIWQELEQQWIRSLKDWGCNLVNSTDGGEGALNPSVETRRKLSSAKIGKRYGIGNKSRTGQKNSEESNTKRRIAMLGRVFSPESLIKMSLAQMGNKKSFGHKNALGHRHTKEMNDKQSIRQIGKKRGKYKVRSNEND